MDNKLKIRKHQLSYQEYKKLGVVNLLWMSWFQLSSKNKDTIRILEEIDDYRYITLTDSQLPKSRKISKEFISFFWKDLLWVKDINNWLIYSWGSQANFYALAHIKQATEKKVVLGTPLVHISLKEACNFLELKFQSIEINKDFSINQEQLKRTITEFHKEIWAIIIVAGTTSLGNIEEIDDDIVSLCKEHNIHIHIDAAYWAYNLWLLEGSSQQKKLLNLFNLPLPKTITADPHKFVGPFWVALLLYCGSNKKVENKVKHYYLTNPDYHITTYSWHTPLLTKKTAEYLWTEWMVELAKINYKNAQKLWETLVANNIDLAYPICSHNVSINLENKEVAEYVHQHLLDKGLSVSRLSIQSPIHSIEWIRIFIWGDKYFEEWDFEEIAAEIKRAIIKNSN